MQTSIMHAATVPYVLICYIITMSFACEYYSCIFMQPKFVFCNMARRRCTENLTGPDEYSAGNKKIRIPPPSPLSHAWIQSIGERRKHAAYHNNTQIGAGACARTTYYTLYRPVLVHKPLLYTLRYRIKVLLSRPYLICTLYYIHITAIIYV